MEHVRAFGAIRESIAFDVFLGIVLSSRRQAVAVDGLAGVVVRFLQTVCKSDGFSVVIFWGVDVHYQGCHRVNCYPGFRFSSSTSAVLSHFAHPLCNPGIRR